MTLPPRFWRNLDWVLLAATFLAAGAGLVAIAGVSGTSLHAPAVRLLVIKQTIWTVLGAGALMACALTDYHLVERWRRELYVLLVLMLGIVLVAGHHSLGSQRWIQVGPLQVQPSEFSKLLLIFWLAAILAPRAGSLRRWDQALLPTLGAALAAGLVVIQPDLGTSMIFCAILAGMLYIAGFSGARLVSVGVLGLGLIIGLVAAHLRWHQVPLPLHNYQLQRLLAFLHPHRNAQSSGYHIVQAEMAIGSGRWTGTGLFSGGINRQLQYLPEAQTDFIFASIANVVGLVGAGFVLIVLAAIVWRALACMLHARDALGALLAGGIAVMIGFQTLLNVGVAVGLLPVTGVPLPFMSYGGSAALVDWLAVGILQSVSVRRRKIQF